MTPQRQASDLSENIISALRSVLGDEPQSLHTPSFDGNEWSYLKECLDSNYVSSVGKFVDRFEKNIADFTGARYAVAVVNGTSALHIALKLAGVGKNDEVLIPALTFVATANAVSYCNAIPHFVDSDEKTLGIDVEKLQNYLHAETIKKDDSCVNRKTGRIIRAIVPMHTFGHPSNLEGLLSLCREFNLVMVEDAAEAIGSLYKGEHVGTSGLFGTLSFNGNKTITTGGGGAILTNNELLAKQAKHITTTAKLPHKWEFRHDQIGFNYRMPNINAAIGCAQLEKLPEKIASKRDLFNRYKIAFSKVEGVHLFQEPEGCHSNYWLQTLLIQKSQAHHLEKILDSTNSVDLMTRPAWNLLNELEPFLECPSMDLECAKSLSQRIVNIPSSHYFFGSKD